MKKVPLSIFVPIALAAVLITLSGCTLAQRMRMYHEPVRVDQFYTTSYSGKLRTEYTTMIQDPKFPKDRLNTSVFLYDAPPRVDRFRRDERICVAIHSFPGEKYSYSYLGGQPQLEWVSGLGQPEVLGTPVSFEHLSVGGSGGGWDATCIRSAPPGDYWRYSRSPSKWTWVDSLVPGTYIVKIKIKERRTERTFTVDTSFTVE